MAVKPLKPLSISLYELATFSALTAVLFHMFHIFPMQPDLDVAVKLLKPALFNSDLDVSDFVKEGIILKRMRHP